MLRFGSMLSLSSHLLHRGVEQDLRNPRWVDLRVHFTPHAHPSDFTLAFTRHYDARGWLRDARVIQERRDPGVRLAGTVGERGLLPRDAIAVVTKLLVRQVERGLVQVVDRNLLGGRQGDERVGAANPLA